MKTITLIFLLSFAFGTAQADPSVTVDPSHGETLLLPSGGVVGGGAKVDTDAEASGGVVGGGVKPSGGVVGGGFQISVASLSNAIDLFYSDDPQYAQDLASLASKTERLLQRELPGCNGESMEEKILAFEECIYSQEVPSEKQSTATEYLRVFYDI